jgi:diacylglycerol kinase (ATP)
MADRSKVVAFVNPRSGERSSADFLRGELERLLPGRVVDLSQCFLDQTVAIDMIRKFALGGTIIVAGGDGTVSFAMDIVDKVPWAVVGEEQRPFITVIPMGTGNDLSRALHFGPGFSKDVCCFGLSGCCRVDDLEETVTHAITAPRSSMDRWGIDVTGVNGVVLDNRTMNNYFSIGFDAHIAKVFDTSRKQHPACFNSRLMNKMWYGCFGCRALCGEPTLETSIKLTVDDKVVALPEGIKSLVVSNVDSFAGGVKLWNDPKNVYKPVSVCDGLLEVQGIYGSTHMGMMQAKMRNAVKIAQGSNITITTVREHWMQWDGEAFDSVRGEECVTIRITRKSTPRILNASLKPNGKDM